MKKKTATPTGSFVPKKDPNVVSRRSPDGSVAIMHLQHEEHYFTIDGIAAELWALIDGKKSLARIEELLIAKFSPPEKQFRKDVSQLISLLTKEGLLT